MSLKAVILTALIGVSGWAGYRVMGEGLGSREQGSPSFLSWRMEGPVATGGWEMCQGVCQSSGVRFPSECVLSKIPGD